MPTGYFIEYGGQFESQKNATRMIGLLGLISLAAMFLALYTLFRSVNLALQVLAALPMAAIGAVAALVVTGQSLTVASMVGFISLSGIASRNGILLIAHYLHLVKHEGETFTKEMIVRAGLERLAPMLMTALTAGIALIPLGAGRRRTGQGNPVSGRHGDPWRVDQFDVVGFFRSPRVVLVFRTKPSRAAHPRRRIQRRFGRRDRSPYRPAKTHGFTRSDGRNPDRDAGNSRGVAELISGRSAGRQTPQLRCASVTSVALDTTPSFFGFSPFSETPECVERRAETPQSHKTSVSSVTSGSITGFANIFLHGLS
ncbi:MAG: efflux RND transporter permease subunit [Pirellulales bacterium]